jgi:hypothetical protein
MIHSDITFQNPNQLGLKVKPMRRPDLAVVPFISSPDISCAARNARIPESRLAASMGIATTLKAD